ncbi:hypothetical protein E2N92_04215 [Methanofollis formosanus]|uniref:Uncharacterized protein n=1 Tax=Methanofollis formosanus TaxID=299308 RepID=A0A8G1A1G1_9EURY|nr:hypothetical protein [Methanofollis formosanus]QYZ78686.1 hypothetical protein E2N92_04215 [Methanofollis formosanus]
MFFESIYLIPIVTVFFAVWFFYPSFTGKREEKISPNEYAWFLLSFVCIPVFGLGLSITILFLDQWYSNPMALDIRFVLFICTPWVVISGAVAVYGVRALWRLRGAQHAVEEREGTVKLYPR